MVIGVGSPVSGTGSPVIGSIFFGVGSPILVVAVVVCVAFAVAAWAATTCFAAVVPPKIIGALGFFVLKVSPAA
jgi:hypothetical protein